ncbi:hypothetical protein QTP88_000923 [Uroleucon formosanum]
MDKNCEKVCARLSEVEDDYALFDSDDTDADSDFCIENVATPTCPTCNTVKENSENSNDDGGEKQKLKIAIEHQNGRQKNSLFKFFKKDLNDTIADSGQIESQINANLQLSDSDDVNFEKVEVQCNTHKKVEVQYNSDCDEYENENVQLVSDDLRPKEDIESRKVLEKGYNNDDPGNWPQNINDKLRIYLVKNPPSKIKKYKFPSNDEGRKFSISERLKEHELSIPHNKAQEKWIQLRMGLDLHKTVDNNIQDNLNIEKERWRSILKRFKSIFALGLANPKDGPAFDGSSMYRE